MKKLCNKHAKEYMKENELITLLYYRAEKEECDKCKEEKQ